MKALTMIRVFGAIVDFVLAILHIVYYHKNDRVLKKVFYGVNLIVLIVMVVLTIIALFECITKSLPLTWNTTIFILQLIVTGLCVFLFFLKKNEYIKPEFARYVGSLLIMCLSFVVVVMLKAN